MVEPNNVQKKRLKLFKIMALCHLLSLHSGEEPQWFFWSEPISVIDGKSS